ncbi:hypothetical protein BHM03_00053996, partial [Ensete ventricosum]
LPGSHSPQWSKEKKKAHVRGVMPEMRKVARNGRPPAKEKKKTPVRSVMPETKYCHVSSTNIAAKNWAAITTGDGYGFAIPLSLLTTCYSRF